jgi:hypothetical protein
VHVVIGFGIIGGRVAESLLQLEGARASRNGTRSLRG